MISGGVIDAIRRAVVDLEIVKWKPLEAWYDYLTPENRELFAEEGVQNSYKYYEFYTNLALSMASLLVLRLFGDVQGLLPSSWRKASVNIFLLGTIIVLGLAAWRQWGYFGKFVAGFIKSQKERKERMLWNNPPTGTEVRTLSEVEGIPKDTEGRLRGTTGYPDDKPDDIFVVDFPTQKRVLRVKRNQTEEVMKRQ